MDRINVRTVNNGGSRMLATVVAALLLAIATTMPFASTQTLAQVATDTPTPEPTISPQQQCVDGGGVWSHDSCHHLQEIAINPQIVTACGVADEHTGRVTCSVGLSGDLPPNYPALQNAVSIAPGCLSINRSPYPRLMVGLGSPTIAIGPAPVASGSAQVSLHNPIFMAPGYPVSGNRQGWYNTLIDASTITGLGGITTTVAGNWYGIPYVYASESLGVAVNDWYVEGSYYPSIRNLSVRLLYVMDDTVEVGLGLSGAGGGGGPEVPMAGGAASDGEPLTLGSQLLLTVTRSSNPNPGGSGFNSNIVNRGGPDVGGGNGLPAYMLQVRSEWQLRVQYQYEVWTIAGGAYRRTVETGNRISVISGWENIETYRAWDRRQGNLTNILNQPYCNALNGYVPVPVMEGHTVLTR